jgi:protein YibB
MSDISLVTAFFNIGRENFKAIPRTDDTYLNNFKFWARMRNNLVVYTDSVTAAKVTEIRANFGLADKTNVIVIDDITSIEPEILDRMKKIRETDWFERFRILPNATSNIPQYSYLMLLKTWFLADATKNGYVDGMVAWIDFGFNHGGKLYTNPEDFDFEWSYDFSDKIHLFYYEKIDKKPTYEMVRRLCDSIMGCIYVLPAHYCETLWELTREAMEHLLAVGLYDDDQMLLLMAYRAKSEIFDMHESKWFLPIKEYGGNHLRVRNTRKRAWYKQAIINMKIKFRNLKLAIRNAWITFVDLAFKE